MGGLFWKLLVLFLLVASGAVWFFTLHKRLVAGVASYYQNTNLVLINTFAWLVFSALFVATVVTIVLVKARFRR